MMTGKPAVWRESKRRNWLAFVRRWLGNAKPRRPVVVDVYRQVQLELEAEAAQLGAK